MQDFINDVIDKNKLTLSISSIVKLITCFDKMQTKCFYKGSADYIPPENCKFCKTYQSKLKTNEVLCRKHYGIKLHNDPKTNISEIFYREELFKLFGRYILRTTQTCNYLFYITPLQISDANFTVFALPDGLFVDRKAKYTWTEFKRPGIHQYELEGETYRLDCSNKYHPVIVKIS